MFEILSFIGTTIAVCWVVWTLIFEDLYLERQEALRRRAAAHRTPVDGGDKS